MSTNISTNAEKEIFRLEDNKREDKYWADDDQDLSAL
jgi:hypothetical protein